MRVPLEHGKRFVAGNAGRFHYVQAFLKEPTGGLVAQVVQSNIWYACCCPGSFPVLT